MRQAVQDIPNITVESYSGLTVGYVRRKGGQVIVRGLRVTYDFELEYQMALTNKKLAPEIETFCLVTSLEYAFLSSSIVKEVAMAGGCIKEMVPPHVVSALQKKMTSLAEEREDKFRLVSLRD